MKMKSVVAGAAAGAVLAAGAIVVLDQGSERADAQGGSSQFVTKAEFNAANQSANARASAAINGYKIANNAITKYFIPQNDLIGAKSGPIRQDRGTGANGLPGSTIQNGAIAREKIANEAVNSEKIAPGGVTSGDLADNSVTNSKLDAAAVSTDKIGAAAVTEAKLADGVLPYYAALQYVAPNELDLIRGRGATQTGTQRSGTGNYRVAFTRDLSECTLFPTLADANYSEDPGLPVAREIAAGVDNANTTRAFVRTYASDGGDVDSDFTIQVIC